MDFQYLRVNRPNRAKKQANQTSTQFFFSFFFPFSSFLSSYRLLCSAIDRLELKNVYFIKVKWMTFLLLFFALSFFYCYIPLPPPPPRLSLSYSLFTSIHLCLILGGVNEWCSEICVIRLRILFIQKYRKFNRPFRTMVNSFAFSSLDRSFAIVCSTRFEFSWAQSHLFSYLLRWITTMGHCI